MDVLFDFVSADSPSHRAELRAMVVRVREALAPLQIHRSAEMATALFVVVAAESRMSGLNWRDMVEVIGRVYGIPTMLHNRPETMPGSGSAVAAAGPCGATLALTAIRVLRGWDDTGPALEKWTPEDRTRLITELASEFETENGAPPCEGECRKRVTDKERVWFGWPPLGETTH